MKTPLHRSAVAEMAPNNRSRVTNGSSLFLPGGARSHARRFRDLLAGYAAELGGMEGLAESEIQIIRRAAVTAVECEALEALRAKGEPVPPDQFALILNASRRATKDFEALRRRRQGAKPATTRLQDMLAARGAGDSQAAATSPGAAP